MAMVAAAQHPDSEMPDHACNGGIALTPRGQAGAQEPHALADAIGSELRILGRTEFGLRVN